MSYVDTHGVRLEAQAEWNGSASVREEFRGNFDAYLAFRLAEHTGQARVLRGPGYRPAGASSQAAVPRGQVLLDDDPASAPYAARQAVRGVHSGASAPGARPSGFAYATGPAVVRAGSAWDGNRHLQAAFPDRNEWLCFVDLASHGETARRSQVLGVWGTRSVLHAAFTGKAEFESYVAKIVQG